MNVIRKLLPKDRNQSQRILTSVLLLSPVYLFRYWQDEIRSQGMAGGFILVGLCVPYLILFCAVCVHFVSNIKLVFASGGSLRPLIYLFLICGFVVYLPVPPLREKVILEENRTEYEEFAQITLAGNLKHEGYCQADTEYFMALATPKEYSNLSAMCVHFYPGSSLVGFNPYSTDYHLVYSEESVPSDEISPCSKVLNSVTVEQIDEHWFVCLEDAN